MVVTGGKTGGGIDIIGVGKSYGETRVLRNVDLTVGDGELVCFLGPSGCGKTTLLRAIAGFHPVDSGRILIAGRDVSGLPPNRRNCGFVFQSYTLFPHMSVRDNVAFGLKIRGMASPLIAARVDEMVRLVRLEGLLDRLPKNLSGGQQQRVAIARALAIAPDVLLFDEPLSNLDAKLREEIRFELRALQKTTGITAIFVTHDQEEAMAMADRIMVMNQGAVEQVGTPTEIYRTPRTRFVADFVGQNNLLPVSVESTDEHGTTFVLAGRTVHVAQRAPGQEVVAAVRPEQIRLMPTESANCWTGTVRFAAFLGAHARYEVALADGTVVKVAAPPAVTPIAVGTVVGVDLATEQIVLVPA
jgi:ABC-type Fe3+/spermidine/putrescine transport system ATPase subunit